MFKPGAKGRDAAALAATQALVAPIPQGGTRPDYLGALTAQLDTLRQPRPGQPLVWVQHLRDDWSSRDLAGAILYRLIRAAVRTEGGERDGGVPPLRSTIATTLGTDLLGFDGEQDLRLKVGSGLLDAADTVDVIEDVLDRGHRVRINTDLLNFVALIVNGAKRSILERYPTQPPTGARTVKRRSMLIEPPPAPPRVVEALNRLQGTPWRVNRAVLARLDTPEETLRLFNEIADHKEAIRKGAVRQLVLAEATVLTHLDRFYISAHLDFRGRVYQDGGLLTYTGGDDLVRGLLEFADGEVPDEFGRGWLAWHAWQQWGNVQGDPAPDLPFGHAWDDDWGEDDDKLGWVDEAIKRTDRWREAEHPAQFLAAALALVDAQAGRPVRVPVRVDATCSALQHLALLARDAELARTVNLWGEEMALVEPPLEPDFYQRVADATGLRRKEVKPVVVRTLYGAGDNPAGEPKHRYTLSKTLARARRGPKAGVRRKDRLDVQTIRHRARTVAPNAFRVLDWLREVAEAHNARAVEIRWTTPSGFEVIQDHRRVDKNPKRPDRRVRVRVNGHYVNLVKRFYTGALDGKKQQSSVKANVVHSMDAALLAELVARAPIEHWAVAHDAFGVPANQVWQLLHTNKDVIASMYGPDRLAEWTAAWRAAGIEVPDPPSHAETLPSEMLRGLRMLG